MLGAMLEDPDQPIATVDDSGLQLELEDNLARLESLKAQLRFQQNNLERLNRLAASNNAAVNQIDQAEAEMHLDDGTLVCSATISGIAVPR